MDTQTGGTSQFETNPDIQSEQETKLPSSYAASSIQEVVNQPTEPQPQIPQEAPIEQEAPQVPQAQPLQEPETPVVDSKVSQLDNIAKEEALDMAFSEEGINLDYEIQKEKTQQPILLETNEGLQYLSQPSSDDPISIPDVDEESDLRPVLEDGTLVQGETQILKNKAEDFNIENKDKGLKSSISGKIILDDEVSDVNDLKSAEGIDPDEPKTAGYYEMPNRNGRYLKESDGQWFKIYTSSRTGKRVKRKIGGLRALSLEDNAMQIAKIDSNIESLWDVSKSIPKMVQEPEPDPLDNFIFQQEEEEPETTVVAFRNFAYSDRLSDLKSRLSQRKEYKGKNLEDTKEMSSILKPTGLYKYGGKTYSKDGGKWFFVNDKGIYTEAKKDVVSIEVNSEPMVTQESIKKNFENMVDYFSSKAQDFANDFSEAVNFGAKKLFDYSVWADAKYNRSITDIVENTLKGDADLSVSKNYEGLTSEELVNAQIQIVDAYGNVAVEKIKDYAMRFSTSVDAFFTENPYLYDGLLAALSGGYMEEGMLKIGEDDKEGGMIISSQKFDPRVYLAKSAKGREQLAALGYLSKFGGFQPPKTQGLYSVGDVVAFKTIGNEWVDVNGTRITDNKKISTLESAGSSLTKENIYNSLRWIIDKTPSRIPKYAMDGQEINLSEDTYIGTMLNSDDRLRDYIMSRPYMEGSSLGRFLNEENGGNPYGSSEKMGPNNFLLTSEEAADLSIKLSKGVLDYNNFLKSEEGLRNFVNMDISDYGFNESQSEMILNTKDEAIERLLSQDLGPDYYEKVTEAYDSARNTIQNIYNANEKLKEVDASGLTVDGFMYANKRRVIPTLANIGRSDQIEDAAKLYELNSGMTDLILSSYNDGKLDIDESGNITFTDRVSGTEKEILESKLTSYQKRLKEFKTEKTSKSIDEISSIKTKLRNIPVLQERLLKRLQDLNPDSPKYAEALLAYETTNRLETIYEDKIRNINQSTDAILRTNANKIVEETSEFKWMPQHLSSIPMSEEFSPKNKFDFLFESLNNRRLQLEKELEITPNQNVLNAVSNIFSSTFGGGMSAKEKEYYETLYTVRALAPIYANNEYSIDQGTPGVGQFFESVISGIYKNFFPDMYRAKGSVLYMDLVTPEEYAQTATQYLKDVGMSPKDFRDERKQYAMEKFANRDLGLSDPRFYGGSIASAAAMVAMITSTGGVIKYGYKGLNALSKLAAAGRTGNAVGHLGIVERTVTATQKAYNSVMMSNPITKAAMMPLSMATEFKVGGLAFNEQAQEHMTFEGGLLGGIFAKGIIAAGSPLGTVLGRNKYLQGVFGDKYGAVMKYMQGWSQSTAIAGGLGFGETAKEVREQLTLYWQSSDRGQKVWDIIEKQYGSVDAATKFVVSTLFMGKVFHLGSNIGKAEAVYDRLSPEQKKRADKIIENITKTSETAVKSAEEVMRTEIERHTKKDALDTLEKEQKTRKDDSKDESRLPSEERKGEEPVEEKPVEEAGKEETGSDRVLQEEKAEAKEELKTEEEVEDVAKEETTEAKEEPVEETPESEKAPSEVESERVSLKYNEAKSEDLNRDVYEIYDEVGSRIGEMTVGSKPSGRGKINYVVENISIAEGKQRNKYATEAIEAFNNGVESNVSISSVNPNSKTVGKSMSKNDNAIVNEKGDVELSKDKSVVEETPEMTTAEKLANNLRRLKVNKDPNAQTFGSMLPLDKAWNFSVEAAAKVIEAGGSTIKAAVKAKKAYRDSAFYKSLKTEAEKISEEAKFMEAIAEQLSIKNVDLTKADVSIEENYKKLEDSFMQSDLYNKSKNKKQLLLDLKKDYYRKVANKIDVSTEEAKMAREAMKKSTRQGRFDAQFQTAMTEAVNHLTLKSPKQLELAAVRARIMRSEKYKQLLRQDQTNTPESIESIKERAKDNPAYEYMSAEQQAEYLSRLEAKANKKREGIETNAAEKYLTEMVKKAARKIGTRSDYAQRYMNEAIDVAAEKYKDSEYYKDALPEQRSKIIEDFKRDARNFIEENIENSMSAEQRIEIRNKVKDIDPEAVKAEKVDRGRGERAMKQAGRSKIEYKVTLNQMLSDKAKFTKEGAKHMEMIKNTIAEYIRINMPKGKYSAKEVSFFLNRVKAAKTQKGITEAFEKIDDAIDKKIGKELSDLRAEVIKEYTGKNLMSKLFGTTKQGKRQAKVLDPQRKEIYEFVEKNIKPDLIETMDLTDLKDLKDEISKMIKEGRSKAIEIEKIVDRSNRRIQASIIEAAPETFKVREDGVYDMNSLMELMNNDGAYAIVDGQYYNKSHIAELIKSKESEFRQSEEYKELETKEEKEAALDQYVEDNPIFDFNSSDASFYRPISEGAKQDIAVDAKTLKLEEQMWSAQGSLTFQNMDLFGSLKYLSRKNDPLWKFIESRLEEPLKDAYVNSEVETTEVRDKMESAMRTIFGKDYTETLLGQIGNAIYGKPLRKATRLVEQPTDLRKNGDPNGEVISHYEQNKAANMKAGMPEKAPTNDNLIHLYLLGKSKYDALTAEQKAEADANPESDAKTITRKRLENQDVDYEAVREYIERPENQDLKMFADWLDNFYNTYARESYAQTYEKVTGGDKFSKEYYYPQKGSKEAEMNFLDPDAFIENGLVDISKLFISAEGIVSDAAKQRTDVGRLSTKDGATDTFLQYNNSMIRQKNYYDIAKDASIIFNNRDVSSMMKQQGGSKNFSSARDHLISVLTGKTVRPSGLSRALNTFAGFQVLTTLMMKQQNLFKQFASFTHFWNAGIKYGVHGNSMFGATVKPILAGGTMNPFAMLAGGPRVGLAKNTTPKEDYAFVHSVLTSPFVRNRYRGGLKDLEVDAAVAMEKGTKFLNLSGEAKKNFTNSLMFFTRAGDMAGVLLGPGGGLSFATNLYRMYRGEGMSVKEAQQKAYRNFVVEATAAQQTTNMAYRSQFQQSTAARMVGMYKTSQMAASKKVLNAVNSLTAGVELTDTQKAQAVSDLIYYSVFASLGFTAVSTGMIYLATGDVPFAPDDEEQDPQKWQEAFNNAYTPEEQQEVFDNVKSVMAYETAWDNVQAMVQGYGVPGFVMDRFLNSVRGKDYYNEFPIVKMTDKLLGGLKTVFTGDPMSMSDEQKQFYKQSTGKEYQPITETEYWLSGLLDGLNLSSQKENLAKLYDTIKEDGVFSKDFVQAWQGWDKNFMADMMKYNRKDLVYERITGKPITDITPSSRKQQVIDQMIETQMKTERIKRDIKKGASGYQTVDVRSVGLKSSNERIRIFGNMLSEDPNKYERQIRNFYNKHSRFKDEKSELGLD